MTNQTRTETIPRIERLKVKNFRALREFELKHLTPLSVLLGPNGSGKSTVFDVFAFLGECFDGGLKKAWDKRGRAKELKSRGSSGPVLIEIAYREKPRGALKTYHLEVDEIDGKPFVIVEFIRWKHGRSGKPFHLLDYKEGSGEVIFGEQPEVNDKRVKVTLNSPDTLAVNVLGQLKEHPRIAALRDFIMEWNVTNLSSEVGRSISDVSPQEHLNSTGSNLVNVIKYLSDKQPDQLVSIIDNLRLFIPKFQDVAVLTLPDGRLYLQTKDSTFEQPIMSQFVSDGTLRMLAYLVLLQDPCPSQFIGIEEPENFLHHKHLLELSAICRKATISTQLLVATHSPFYIDHLRPNEVHVLWRDEGGYTKSHSLGNSQKIKSFIDNGALLGDLWSEGFFEIDNPLVNDKLS